MKNVFAVSLLSLISANAFAADSATLTCSSRPGAPMVLSLNANVLILSGQNQGSMFDVVMKVRENGKSETGRARVIDADEDYSPRKYRAHSRFSMGKLVDTKTFDRFLPGDSCILNVLIPNGALRKTTFAAPVIVNCDQSGGTVMMTCQLTDKR